MVRGKISPGTEKVRNLSLSDSREQNDEEIILPRGSLKKNNELSSSSKLEDERKAFPKQHFAQSTDEQHSQQQIQPKRGRGRPRKNPIATTITNNDIDQNSSISNNSESSSSKIILNNQDINELDDNLNESNDDHQHNMISVIEIVDESQDNSITNIINIQTENNTNDNSLNNNLEYSNESQIELTQHDESIIQLQNDTNSISIEDVIDKPANFNNDDYDDDVQPEIIKKERENFDIDIITISSDESNFKTELKLRDTPTSELIGRGSGGADDIVSSPDILHVHINPNSARTYQNKRKSKIDNDNNIHLNNLSNNNSMLDKNILELNQFKQNNEIVDIEENLQISNDSTINSIECRRSSRKKTMKYDVRDLLNKNRKKIQIEARIDSLPAKSNEYSGSNEMADNNCKLSPLSGIPKINELHDIITRIPEPPQLNPILLNEMKISPPQLTSGTNFTKNLIQIQSRKSFENSTNQFPPPPPLKLIAELDRRNNAIPNSLYSNELNKNNKIYSFHDAFNSGIIKSGDNECSTQSKIISSSYNTIEMSQTVKNISSTIVSTSQLIPTTATTISTPVLSSMVKSPLLNIKFKHQNLAIRKSFDSLINGNSASINLHDTEKNIIKEIQPQINIEEQRKSNELVTEKSEKPIRVKGKRGRPPKNKLVTSPRVLDISSTLIKAGNKIENKCEVLENCVAKTIQQSEHLLLASIKKKNENIENAESLSMDNKIKGKRNNDISPITNNANLNPINTNYSNVVANFKFMESKVKIKRLSNRSSTESIDNNTNNKYNNFTDCKINDVIEKSDDNNKKDEYNESNYINKERNMNMEVNNIQESEVDKHIENINKDSIVEVKQQNIKKETTSNIIQPVEAFKKIVNSEKIISTDSIELQKNKLKIKLKDEKSSKTPPTKKKYHAEFEKLEKKFPTNKKKPKDISNKESSDHLQESPKKSKHQKDSKKKLEDGKPLFSKTTEKCEENDRKIILPQNKLFLETEKIHELKLQKLERKKSLQHKDKEYTEKSVFKNWKKIAIEEKNSNQIEKNEIEQIAIDTNKNLGKTQEEIKTICETNYSIISGESVKDRDHIFPNQLLLSSDRNAKNVITISENINQNIENKPILEIHKKDEQEYRTDFLPQKYQQIFEQLAEKLIDNEINNSLNSNENISICNEQNNEIILNSFEEKLIPKIIDYQNIQNNVEILEDNKIESNDTTANSIQKSENTIQDENCFGETIYEANCSGSSTVEINKNKVSTKYNTTEEELSNETEKLVPVEKDKNIPTIGETSKNDTNDTKIVTLNSSTEISASPSIDSNDPLKDIEKFIEAAGNLLSRSLSSEDEKDPSHRRSRTGTRFKDCASKDDDIENNSELSVVDCIREQNDTEIFEKSILSQLIKDDPKITTYEKEVKHNLDIDIRNINKEELKVCEKYLAKIGNMNTISNPGSTHSYQNISNNIQPENNEKFLVTNKIEFPTVINESLNFSHKFPMQENSNASSPIEKRTAGPRTPPFPPPNDLPIDEENSFFQNSLKSEESLLNIENNSNIVSGSVDLHSDSMTSNSSKSTENLKIRSFKKIENDLKLIKKLKRKDEKKLKKKDGITDELKRTIKEMKKIKNSTPDGNLVQSTLSKAAMKSYSPINLIDNGKTDGDSRSLDSFDLDENQIIYDQNNKNIRRSHRLKTITKSQSVGRGLVRDRERYDKEYDDIKPDLAVIEAQNAKFLKDMEERLSQFQVIRDNEYKCERVISKEAKKMICDCFLTREEEERGEFGCGEDCLNRLLMIECGPKCTVGDRCTNRRFQRAHYAPCKVFQTAKKGCGIMADAEIPCGQFIMEYVGEVLNSNQFEKRAEMYSEDKNKHYYFMALRSDAIIDATTRGNISRFINHSCNPNAETQKWTVNGELRIGFFTTRTVLPGEEITFDYQFQRYGKEAQRCYCDTSNCRGWIGEEPEDSDEEELEDESEDDEKIKTEIKKEISQKIIKEIPNDQQNIFKPKSVQDISQKTDTDIDKENIGLIKIKPDKKENKKRGRKKRLDFRLGKKNYEFIDDPDLEDEVLRLLESGLKNQVQTLCLSRLFVRAKQLETRLNLLEILRKGEMSCRRLFLDYHGLKLLHGWMSETSELVKDTENDLKIRLNLLETLECLPIPNKTMLKDSKVFQTVHNWSQDKTSTESSPNDGSPNDNSNSGLTTPKPPTDYVNIDSEKPSILLNTNESLSVENPLKIEIKNISIKLITIWDGLPEVFRIPRKERVEQMKEHEREADKQYAALKLVDDDNEIRRNRGRFIKDIKDNTIMSNNTDLTPNSGGSIGKYKWSRDIKSDLIKERRKEFEKFNHLDGLSKLQRRQIFAAKVAQDEAEKRLADEKREFDIKCKFYGLDSLTTHPSNFPFCVNPATGQWYTIDRRKIPTPPSHAHIKVPPKPQSTKPEDYQLPPLDLPPFWKFAIDPHKGRIYYYHMKIRIPQWEPPIKIFPLNDGSGVTGDSVSDQTISGNNKDIQNDENDSTDSGSESGDSLNDKNKDETTADGKLSQALSPEQKKMERKKKRYALLVQERPISPRREEDRVYNQIEMRRYKENKEKIRRRKEEMKRRKIQLARQLTDQQNNPDPVTITDTNEESVTQDQSIESDSGVSATSSSSGVEPLPIADYLLSSDEEETITRFCDANLIEKIVKGEKIVDELDALNINRPLKRLLSFKEKSSPSNIVNSVEHKSKKSKTDDKKLKNDDEIKKPKSASKLNNPKYLARKAKEKFRADIAGIIVLHLTPYRKETCKIGRITKNEDFKHLARKLTHFVMVKELKHCDLTGQQLIVTDSVKNKSREFIKKYMAKYGEIYIRPENDPEFKEIPH